MKKELTICEVFHKLILILQTVCHAKMCENPRCWTSLEIDLNNLEHNAAALQKALPPKCELMAVVKASEILSGYWHPKALYIATAVFCILCSASAPILAGIYIFEALLAAVRFHLHFAWIKTGRISW